MRRNKTRKNKQSPDGLKTKFFVFGTKRMVSGLWASDCSYLCPTTHTEIHCAIPEVRVERKPIALVVDRHNEVDRLSGHVIARVLVVIAVVVAAVAVVALLLLLLLKLCGEQCGRKRTEARTIAIAVAAAAGAVS